MNKGKREMEMYTYYDFVGLLISGKKKCGPQTSCDANHTAPILHQFACTHLKSSKRRHMTVTHQLGEVSSGISRYELLVLPQFSDLWLRHEAGCVHAPYISCIIPFTMEGSCQTLTIRRSVNQ